MVIDWESQLLCKTYNYSELLVVLLLCGTVIISEYISAHDGVFGAQVSNALYGEVGNHSTNYKLLSSSLDPTVGS